MRLIDSGINMLMGFLIGLCLVLAILIVLYLCSLVAVLIARTWQRFFDNTPPPDKQEIKNVESMRSDYERKVGSDLPPVVHPVLVGDINLEGRRDG